MVQRGAGLSCSPFPNNSPARPALGKAFLVFEEVPNERLVELARAYVADPQFLIANIRDEVVDGFPKVFKVVYRQPSIFRIWEWVNPYLSGEVWEMVDGPPPPLLSMTESQEEYVARGELLWFSGRFAAKRVPELFKEFPFKEFWEFLEECTIVKHGWGNRRVVDKMQALRWHLARFEEWIQLNKNDGGEVPPTCMSGNFDPAEVDGKTSTTSVVSVNAQMLDIMQSVGNEVCLGWSVEDWREKLGERFGRKPAKSTIHKQPTWDLIRTLRVQAGTEAHEHQTAKDETGRRRSRAT
jgi:hypothetical protein